MTRVKSPCAKLLSALRASSENYDGEKVHHMIPAFTVFQTFQLFETSIFIDLFTIDINHIYSIVT